MTTVMSLAEVKSRLSEVVDRVTQSHDRVTITRHGHPQAIVIAVDDLEALEETLDLLSDPDATVGLAAARAAALRDEGLDEAAVRARYLDA